MKIMRSVGFFGVSLAALSMAACAMKPMGPTVQVLPGPRKTFEAFQLDAATCQQYSSQQVAGQAEAANNQAIGGAVLATALGAGLGAAIGGGNGAAIGAATGAGLGAGGATDASSMAQGGIQFQYDNAYSQCMYSKGNQVAGWTPPPDPGAERAPRVAQGPSPALVRSVQGELIRLNYLSGPADGQLGGKTVSAIRTFEQSDGLKVDGAVTQRLLAKLQATTTGSAVASTGWIAPTGTPGTPPAGSGWVSPMAAQQ